MLPVLLLQMPGVPFHPVIGVVDRLCDLHYNVLNLNIICFFFCHGADLHSSEILVVKISEEEVSGSQRRKHIGCLCTGMEHGFAQAALWPSPGNVLRRFYRDPYAAN